MARFSSVSEAYQLALRVDMTLSTKQQGFRGEGTRGQGRNMSGRGKSHGKFFKMQVRMLEGVFNASKGRGRGRKPSGL
jgi:hypothetical protein